MTDLSNKDYVKRLRDLQMNEGYGSYCRVPGGLVHTISYREPAFMHNAPPNPISYGRCFIPFKFNDERPWYKVGVFLKRLFTKNRNEADIILPWSKITGI